MLRALVTLIAIALLFAACKSKPSTAELAARCEGARIELADSLQRYSTQLTTEVADAARYLKTDGKNLRSLIPALKKYGASQRTSQERSLSARAIEFENSLDAAAKFVRLGTWAAAAASKVADAWQASTKRGTAAAAEIESKWGEFRTARAHYRDIRGLARSHFLDRTPTERARAEVRRVCE